MLPIILLLLPALSTAADCTLEPGTFLIENMRKDLGSPKRMVQRYITLGPETSGGQIREVSVAAANGDPSQDWSWEVCTGGPGPDRRHLVNPETEFRLYLAPGLGSLGAASLAATSWSYDAELGTLQDLESLAWATMIKRKTIVKMDSRLRFRADEPTTPWESYRWTLVPKGYVPGTPGGPWTEDEVRIVKEKVRLMIHPEHTLPLYSDTERFPLITNLVFGNIWDKDNPDNKHWFNATFSRANREITPSPRKLIQLAFHDCLKNVDAEGRQFGGCDGCLNWKGMDFMNQVPYGNLGSTSPIWPSYHAQPITYATDNNKLSTTVYALELVYEDPTWPPGAPSLPASLKSTGKSRADLWQLAANTALEVEMAKANYGCSHKVSFQQFVVALEGRESCLWRLHKPVPFQYGRADCVKEVDRAKTEFPFEATNNESHSNPFGQADWVLKDLKRDFGLPARQSIALMAVHGITPQVHNGVLEVQYRWAGGPFISNLYYKTLGSKPQYEMGAGLAVNGDGKGVLVGDKAGQPLGRDIQGDMNLSWKSWWNTTLPDSGPWFFKPMTPNIAPPPPTCQKPGSPSLKPLSPVSATLSSLKNKKSGPKNCIDSNPGTFCKTKKEFFPFLVLDFGTSVEISSVKVVANPRWPQGILDSRVIISNETATPGIEAEGELFDQDNDQVYRGRYVILQRNAESKAALLNVADIIVCSAGTVNNSRSMETDHLPREPCFSWNYTTSSYDRFPNAGCQGEDVTIDETTGVQKGGPARRYKGPSWGFTFFLPYEVSFVKNFTVDGENHPRGCNIPDVVPEWGTGEATDIARTPVDCPRAEHMLEGEGETSAQIVDEFAESHESWAREFLEGWQVIQKNGYEDSLTDGPESSWLGYSLMPEGADISFPLLFTENLNFDLEPFLCRGDRGAGLGTGSGGKQGWC